MCSVGLLAPGGASFRAPSGVVRREAPTVYRTRELGGKLERPRSSVAEGVRDCVSLSTEPVDNSVDFLVWQRAKCPPDCTFITLDKK
jgi:hypothetical protein